MSEQPYNELPVGIAPSALKAMTDKLAELQAENARLTRERDERVVLPEMTENSCFGIFGCGDGQGYGADFHNAQGEVKLNVKERKPTPAAALQALADKMKETT